MVGALTAIVAALVLVLASGDSGSQGGRSFADALSRRGRPDELPVMLNEEPPFRYPAPLRFARSSGSR